MRIAKLCSIAAMAAAFSAAVVATPADALAQSKHRRTAKPPVAPLDPEAAEDVPLRTGIELVEARDPKRAIPELERLHASTNKPRALYWLARAYLDAGRHADALRTFKRFLRDGGTAVPQSRSVEVLGHVQTLTMQVAIVTVTAPAGATITVDDAAVGEAPLAEPLYVDPGKHTIAARGAGTKTIDVAEESRTSVELAPAVAPSPAPPPPPAAPAPSAATATTTTSSSSNGTVTVVGLGLATLLAGGSVYFTVKALGSASDFDAKKTELGATREDLDGLQSKTRLQSGVALGLGVAALATAGVTLFVLRKPSGRETRVVTTGSGLAITGGF